MRRGKKVIVPGDGSSLWVITHNSDFAVGLVGLLGNQQAIGHAFHITGDEVMTWDQYYNKITAQAAGVEAQIVHITSDFVGACMPEEIGGFTGDKSVCVVFDSSKIKRFVPGYCAKLPLPEGSKKLSLGSTPNPSERIEKRQTRPGTSSSPHMKREPARPCGGFRREDGVTTAPSRSRLRWAF